MVITILVLILSLPGTLVSVLVLRDRWRPRRRKPRETCNRNDDALECCAMPTPRPPEPLRSYLASFDDAADTDPLRMLTRCDNVRTGLRDYEKRLVREARRQNATWDDIGKALGIPRQNAHRRFS
jgi:hypothetical protein